MKKNLLLVVFAAAVAVLFAGCGGTNDPDVIISYVKKCKMTEIGQDRTLEQAVSSNFGDVKWSCQLGRNYIVIVSGRWKHDELLDDGHNVIVKPNQRVEAKFEYKCSLGLFESTKLIDGYINGSPSTFNPDKDFIKFKDRFFRMLCHQR